MTGLDRRTMLTAAAGLAALPSVAVGQTGSSDEIIDLWPGLPPGAMAQSIKHKVDNKSKDPAILDRWLTGIERPTLVVRRPARPNGAAMLVIPGGGYGFVSYDKEGTDQAAWLNARGITAFILVYRLPAEGWRRREDVPLQDAQRAMRLIRARSAELGVDGARIGVLGFSAGGHLAGSLATRHGESIYDAVDAADQQDARPALAALIYPVVSLQAPFTHGGSRDNLLGSGASAEMQAARSVEQRVDASTPPLFMVHATDDGLVPPANSIALYQAMESARRPVALHLFEDGGHGFGTRLPAARQVSIWPELLMRFVAAHELVAA